MPTKRKFKHPTFPPIYKKNEQDTITHHIKLLNRKKTRTIHAYHFPMEIKILDIDGYNKVAGLNRLLTYWISQVNVSVKMLYNLLLLQILIESLDDRLLFMPRGRQFLIIHTNKRMKNISPFSTVLAH